jgi:predicted nucleic acid-binding protein
MVAGRAGKSASEPTLTAALLDTSVIVRYLTGDPKHLASRAARIIDGETSLLVTDVVVAETAFVLSSVYGVPRRAVVDRLVELLQRRNLSVFRLDKGAVIQGLLLCRPSNRISFADAMVWAAARSARVDAVYSFDERFPSGGIQVRRDRP